MLWHDTATRRCWRQVHAHSFWNWQIALSLDGRHLAAANMMGEVRIWDLQSGVEELAAQRASPDFTSWGNIKSHHYCGGIFELAFDPSGALLLLCGMGPMTDPMAGSGRMTWQRWDWQKGARLDQIKEGQLWNPWHGIPPVRILSWLDARRRGRGMPRCFPPLKASWCIQRISISGSPTRD